MSKYAKPIYDAIDAYGPMLNPYPAGARYRRGRGPFPSGISPGHLGMIPVAYASQKAINKAKGKKPTKVKSNARLSNNVKSIQSKITKLKKLDDATTGTLVYRRALTYASLSNPNEQAVFSGVANNTSLLETALAQTKYFNPAVPGTLTTGSSVAGTYQRNILIAHASMKLKVRNNYQVPTDYVAYLCKVKDDTSQQPSVAWSSGIADGSNLSALEDLNQYPSDYNLFNDLWKMKVLKKGRLEAGQSITLSHSEKDIEYDSATVDTHALSYQKEYKSFGIMIVHKGVIGHDSASDLQGLLASGLDIERIDSITVKYSAGINISYTYVDNTYDTFTATPLVSNKPVSDNTNYSAV